MISTLIKRELKANYKILLIFMAILSMYCSVIVMMYDPTLGESLYMMAKSMPQLFAAFGMMHPGITLLDFIINYLYGFIMRYPKNKEYITGYSYEPWHYRYVGVDIATYIYENNITLEEYHIEQKSK